MVSFLAQMLVSGIISSCWPGAPCANQPQPQLQPVQHAQGNPGVTVYHIPGNAIQNQITFDQIQNIGLNCGQKDVIINYLEGRVGNQPGNPEQLTEDARRVNSAARGKIWQLRTYC
jgi:hypothetical protein